MAHAVVDCRYFIGSFRDGDASAVANEVAGGLRAWERWRPNLDALIAGVTFTAANCLGRDRSCGRRVISPLGL